MRLLAFLLALAAARAATVPQKQVTQKLVDAKDVVKDETPLDNVSSDQELIDPSNTVKDVENNLRKGVPAGIPVKVVVEQAQGAVKEQANEVGIDSDDTSNIKRVEVDLKNPGPPQRIEHDTQNPEHFDDGQTSLNNVDLKQDIIDTESTFDGNMQNIQQSLQNWLASSQHIANVQKGLETMKASVEAQISQMNQTIHKYWAPTAANIQSVAEGTKLNIEAGLKTLEKNVQSGMKVFSQEIKAIGSSGSSVKAEEGQKPPASDNNQWLNGFYNQWLNFTQSVQSQLTNMTNTWNQFTQNNNNSPDNSGQTNIIQQFQQNLQNLWPQGNPPGTQSDDTQRPTIWQSIQSIFQGQPPPPTSVENDPVQGSTPAKPSSNFPIVQAIQNGIQNNPITQGIQSIIRPQNTQAQPQPAKPEAPAAASEGSNAVPEKPAEPEKQKEKPEVQPVQLAQNGPIREMIEKNPIVQGLAGAVQRIQHTIRPTSPREAAAQKGHHGASSNDEPHSSGVKVKSEEVKKPEPDSQKDCDKKEEPSKLPAKKEDVPKKTE